MTTEIRERFPGDAEVYEALVTKAYRCYPLPEVKRHWYLYRPHDDRLERVRWYRRCIYIDEYDFASETWQRKAKITIKAYLAKHREAQLDLTGGIDE